MISGTGEPDSGSLLDHQLPPGVEPPTSTHATRHGTPIVRAIWDAESLEGVARELAARGGATLRELAGAPLLSAWLDTVALWRDPESTPRQSLDPLLAAACGLSPEGVRAGLEAVLGGVDGEPVRELFTEAPRCGDARPAVLIVAGNLPGLAVQSLLPALAVGRPTLIKSPSIEPLFAPAFVATLVEREPELAPAIAACTWSGGDRRLEERLLSQAGRIVAYGDARTMRDLRERCAERLVAYGPRFSLAVIGDQVEPAEVAPGLARDIALFDQRGCLSIHAIVTTGSPVRLAEAVTAALADRARAWPAGTATLEERASVRLTREEGAARGLQVHALDLTAGTVIVDPEPTLQPSPGLRTVRIHTLERTDRLVEILQPWAGRIQGVAVAGATQPGLRTALEALGASRIAAPGELQTPDALWHNGGVSPLEALR